MQYIQQHMKKYCRCFCCCCYYANIYTRFSCVLNSLVTRRVSIFIHICYFTPFHLRLVFLYLTVFMCHTVCNWTVCEFIDIRCHILKRNYISENRIQCRKIFFEKKERKKNIYCKNRVNANNVISRLQTISLTILNTKIYTF